MLAALRVRALLVLVGVVLIPYERTCIEVPASLQVLACWCGTDTLRTNLYRSACLCLLHYRPCLLVLGCLLLVLTALQVRALLVLAGVVLIPYERTCIEVLAGVCCITGLACWCLLVWY